MTIACTGKKLIKSEMKRCDFIIFSLNNDDVCDLPQL